MVAGELEVPEAYLPDFGAECRCAVVTDDIDEPGRHRGAAVSVGEQRRRKDTGRVTAAVDEFAREVIEEARRQQIVRKHGAGSAATALFDELLQRHSPTGKEADLDWTLELCGQQPAHLTT